MNIVTTKVGDKVTLPGTTTLSLLFPPDQYGTGLKYIDVIIPSGHTFYFQSKPATGWKFTGTKIEIVSGSGDSHVYRIDLRNENETGTTSPTWLDHEVSWDANQFFWFIGYY